MRIALCSLAAWGVCLPEGDACGGVKGGMRHGSSHEHRIEVADKKMHIHDLHATALYILDLDHTRLTYPYSGRDFRLTDVPGNVATEIIA
ncbi:MAG: DUF1501 domain-containing protein [Pirellulaceae bacterium]|nr:DUF1501 domain-containing protein [Pirellulaceae bacterium]